MGSPASLRPSRQEAGGAPASRALGQPASRRAVLHPVSVSAEGTAAALRRLGEEGWREAQRKLAKPRRLGDGRAGHMPRCAGPQAPPSHSAGPTPAPQPLSPPPTVPYSLWRV